MVTGNPYLLRTLYTHIRNHHYFRTRSASTRLDGIHFPDGLRRWRDFLLSAESFGDNAIYLYDETFTIHRFSIIQKLQLAEPCRWKSGGLVKEEIVTLVDESLIPPDTGIHSHMKHSVYIMQIISPVLSNDREIVILA